MNTIIKLVIDYQKTNDEKTFDRLLKVFDNLINKYVKLSKNKDFEDIKQELIMVLYKIIKHFKIKNHEISQFYLEKFKTKYQITKFDYKEFNLFCNENEFLKYVEVSFRNHLISYYRKQTKEECIEFVEDLEDYPDIISYEDIKFELNQQEMAFLSLFIENNHLLTEKEVAKKLGISQQAVSKRKNKIIKKYKSGCK